MHCMKRFMLSAGAVITLTAALLPIFPFASAALAASHVTVYIDGAKTTTEAIHRNDRQYVPAGFFRNAGASVSWDERSQTVTVSKGTKRIAYPSGPQVIHRKSGTFIPLRHTAESLTRSVHYDASTQHITIRTNPRNRIPLKSAVPQDDFYWLAQITEAEAGGEPCEGKVAVAAVVLNRVASPNWPNSIQDVIFQVVEVNGTEYYQFSPVADGRIYEVEPTEETYRAVQDALNGMDPTNGAAVFYNPDKTSNRWVRERPVITTIGGHIFSF